MNILEELWYGNIYPNEQSINSTAYAASAQAVLFIHWATP